VRYVGGFPAVLKVDERINASYVELNVSDNRINPMMKRVYIDTSDLIPRSDGGWLLQLVRKGRYDVTPTKILLDNPNDILAMKPVTITSESDLEREETTGRLSPETVSRVKSVLAVYEPMSVDEKRIFISSYQDIIRASNTWLENYGLTIAAIFAIIVVSVTAIGIVHTMFKDAGRAGVQVGVEMAREAANVTIDTITSWLNRGGVEQVVSGGMLANASIPVVPVTSSGGGG